MLQEADAGRQSAEGTCRKSRCSDAAESRADPARSQPLRRFAALARVHAAPGLAGLVRQPARCRVSMELASRRRSPGPSIDSSARCLGQGASGRVHCRCMAPWQRHRHSARCCREALQRRDDQRRTAEPRDGGVPRRLAPTPTSPVASVSFVDHPDGVDALVMPLLPSHWQVLAGPPSLASCSRDVYEGRAAVFSEEVALRDRRRALPALELIIHRRGLLHGDLYAHNVLWDGVGGRRGAERLRCGVVHAARTPLHCSSGWTFSLSACCWASCSITLSDVRRTRPQREHPACLRRARSCSRVYATGGGRGRPPGPDPFLEVVVHAGADQADVGARSHAVAGSREVLVRAEAVMKERYSPLTEILVVSAYRRRHRRRSR